MSWSLVRFQPRAQNYKKKDDDKWSAVALNTKVLSRVYTS